MSKATLVYAQEEPPDTYSKAIFLAGPTPRNASETPSWRRTALSFLPDDFDGVVFVPEYRPGSWRSDDYQAQLAWEEKCLHLADVIIFWVNRRMDILPGLTTNVEFGRWEDSGKVLLGTPDDAEQVRYLKHHAFLLDVPVFDDLQTLLLAAIEKVGEGAQRTAGERTVPLHIWQTAAFQQWYDNLKQAGNRLESARQVWTFRVGPQRNIVFLWALHVDVYIAAEDRHKTNEVVLARPDIATIVLYAKPEHSANVDDTTLVLIREFRSPVNNTTGYVYEVPGGSSFKPGNDPRQLACDETYEETGLYISAERFVHHQARQLVATLSVHRAHLFSAELTDEDLRYVLAQTDDTPHGVEEDSERTYLHVTSLGEIRRRAEVDWSMLGMIMQVIV